MSSFHIKELIVLYWLLHRKYGQKYSFVIFVRTFSVKQFCCIMLSSLYFKGTFSYSRHSPLFSFFCFCFTVCLFVTFVCASLCLSVYVCLFLSLSCCRCSMDRLCLLDYCTGFIIHSAEQIGVCSKRFPSRSSLALLLSQLSAGLNTNI